MAARGGGDTSDMRLEILSVRLEVPVCDVLT